MCINSVVQWFRGKPTSHPHDVEELEVAPLDLVTDITQLRWVGSEFIFFLDVPWDYELQQKIAVLAEASDTPDTHDPAHATDMSTRSITFGLLQTVLDMGVPDDHLIAADPHGQPILSSDRLSRLVVPWARTVATISAESAESKALHARRGRQKWEVLRNLTHSLDDAVYRKAGSLVTDGADSDMLCAVATMIASLEACVRAAWKEEIGDAEIVNGTRMYGEVTQILRRKFLSSSWGPQAFMELERILSGGIPFTAHALSYTRTANNVLHVDTGSYQPKHVDSTCSCAFVKPDVSAIQDLVSAREVPVVVLDGNGTSLAVHKAGGRPYVAISHVWADGLGSTSEVGLPQCQVRRLARLASKLVPDGAFWQDGLCIPEKRDVRKAAITLMKETYALADKVLVLDEGVRTTCSLESTKEECMLRIATSGWTQRIWTLQEGMLGRELHFEFGGDSIVNCTYFNGFSFPLACKVIPLFGPRRDDASAFGFKQRLELAEQPKCSVNDLIGLLRYRSTSKQEDEPVAVSGLLGIDPGRLVRLDSRDERMREMFLMVRRLPRQLVVQGWMNTRLSLPNFGWAPTSLSHIVWPGDPEDALTATCTADGLFSNFTVIRFERVRVFEPIGVLFTLTTPKEEPRIFNLVLSPPFVHALEARNRQYIDIDGFVMKETLKDSMREEGVAAVTFDDTTRLPNPDDGQPTLTCKWAAPASVRFGLPDQVETSRSRYAWVITSATERPLERVRLI